jgi:hypothetical protein
LGAPALAAPITSASATASFLDMSLTRLAVTGSSYYVDASTPFFSDFDFALTPVSFNTSTAGGVSLAQIDNSLSPLPGTHAAAELDGEGHATALWSLDWVATSTGRAFFGLDYLYDATVQSMQAGQRALARSYASLLLEGTSLSDSAVYFLDNVDGNLFDLRTLSLSFDVVAGQTGTFTMALNSDARVVKAPEPAALLLLGSALAGLVVVRRQRRLLK